MDTCMDACGIFSSTSSLGILRMGDFLLHPFVGKQGRGVTLRARALLLSERCRSEYFILFSSENEEVLCSMLR
jgi:hypothetical protein